MIQDLSFFIIHKQHVVSNLQAVINLLEIHYKYLKDQCECNP